ncbi:MAG: transporter substrate-binding domain-containing protein, partial [Oscillospiraceae bacterium]|nr:transporter substrate-binding domain-containing protein [Oscillospiraceae bacterium]
MTPRRIAALFTLAALCLGGFAGCMAAPEPAFDIASVTSYRDIPGITNAEIDAIKALRASRQSFSFGRLISTEGFVLPDGTYAGFSPLFCELLSGLFEIPFVLEFYEWDVLVDSIENGTLDFTSEYTITPERRSRFHMSSPVAQRSLGILTYGDRKVETPEDLNGLRIGVLPGSAVLSLIADAYPELQFEAMPVLSAEAEIEMLQSGRIDAVIGISTRIAYDYEGTDLTLTHDLLPLAYTPVALTTANDDFEPLISALDKYLAAGGLGRLYELYRAGSDEYRRYKLYQSFSEEERAYIDALSGTVPLVLGTDIYPISFYNERENEFQGISADVLKMISGMTGIEFEVINDPDASWGEILEALSTGEAAIICELMLTEERKEQFLWSETPYFSSSYAFLSKLDDPHLELHQIEQARVGLVESCATHDLYRRFFPDNSNSKVYSTHDEALDALEQNDIDLFFTLDYILRYQINYREKPGYKVNYVFPATADSLFGFHKDEDILCAIVSKAMTHIHTEEIVRDWTSRVFDYSRALARQQASYMTVFIVVLSMALILIMVLAVAISRRERLIRRQSVNLQLSLDNMTSILSKSDVMIYVSDADTHELLFMNERMKQHFNLDDSVIGKPCYEILQEDMTERCDFCPCHELDENPDGVVVWEDYNQVTGQVYRKSDQYADWPGGKRVHIQHCIEITDIKKAQEELELRSNLLHALNRAGSFLMDADIDSFEDALYRSMAALAKAVTADRVRIWKNHTIDGKLHCTQLYEWSEGAPPQRGSQLTINVPYSETVPGWEETLSRGECINNLVRNLSPQAQAQLSAQGVLSFLAVPVLVNNQFWGQVGFDDCHRERIFTGEEESLLRSGSMLFTSALFRNEMVLDIRSTSARLESALEQVTDAHENMMTVLNSIPVGIRIVNQDDGELVYANKASMDIFGCEDFERDVAGKSAFDFMPEIQSNGRTTAEMAGEFFTQDTATMDFDCFRLSGEPFTARITSRNVMYKDKLSSLAIIEDISARKRMEDTLQKALYESNRTQKALEIQQNTLQTMINSMPDFVFGKNLNFEYTLLNHAAARYLNVDMDDIIGKNDVNGLKFPPEVAEKMIAQDRRIFNGEQKFIDEHWIPAYDGSERYFETTKAPIIQDGVVIGLVGTSRDITEKKQMEEALREANYNARNARTQEFISKFSVPFTQPYDFDELIQNALFELRGFTGTDRAIILEFQPDGSLRCTYENVINENTPKALGRSLLYEDWQPLLDEAEKTGCFYEKEAARYFERHPATNLDEKSFCYIPLMIEGERAGYLVFFTMFEQANWAEGEFRLATMSGSIIAGAFSNRRNNLLKEEAMKAQQASEAKSHFLSVMSHEMRTPMNAIIGMTVIGKRSESVEEKNYALGKIGDASSHLLGVINDVLDMAKIEANKLVLMPVEFNFEKMLQKVTTVTHFRIEEKRQMFSVYIDRKIPKFLIGDDQRLVQVLANLLSNAIKFTPEGGEIRLEAYLECENGEDCELRIEVADNGIGIAPEQHEKLFEMFEQAESGTSREYGGTGLGLGISKRIVELMGGRIWIESELGQGARFIFIVQVRRGAKNPRSLLSPGVNWDNVRILAVDDAPEIHEQFH